MLTSARSFFGSQRDASKLVQQAEKFSVRLPIVGRVSVPPPDQLAFYGALGLLAAVEMIDWPVALAIGVGQAVVARHFTDRAVPAAERTRPPAAEPAPPPGPELKAVAPAEATSAAAGSAPARKSAPPKSTPRKTAA